MINRRDRRLCARSGHCSPAQRQQTYAGDLIGYATKYLIDTDNAIILDVEASRAIRQAEVGASRTMLDRTAERFGIKPHSLAADSAYGSAANLAWLVKQRGIAPHIPVFDKSGRTDGTLSRSDFVFDVEHDHYTCPEGQAAGAVPSNLRDAALRHHQGRHPTLPG